MKQHFFILACSLSWASYCSGMEATLSASIKRMSPFYKACQEGNLGDFFALFETTTAQSMLEVNSNGWNPLHIAVVQGNLTIVSALLNAYSPFINVQDNQGQTPLFLAALTGNSLMTALLLEHGADTSLATYDGRTPLHEALSNGHEEVAELLVKKGANPVIPDKEGTTPWHEAVENKLTNSLLTLEEASLLSSENKNKPAEEAEVPLWNDYFDILKATAPETVRTADSSGWNPLHLAVAQGNLEIASNLLVSHENFINVQDKQGQTPLFLAVLTANSAMVSLLLKYGANSSLTNNAGRTPLEQALFNGCEDIVNILLRKEKTGFEGILEEVIHGLTPVEKTSLISSKEKREITGQEKNEEVQTSLIGDKLLKEKSEREDARIVPKQEVTTTPLQTQAQAKPTTKHYPRISEATIRGTTVRGIPIYGGPQSAKQPASRAIPSTTTTSTSIINKPRTGAVIPSSQGVKRPTTSAQNTRTIALYKAVLISQEQEISSSKPSSSEKNSFK